MSQLLRSVIGEVGVFLPVGLHEDAVDDVDINDAGGRTDGFDEAADAEVAGLAQDAVGGADDEVDGRRREGVVAEAGMIEFAKDEVAQGVGREPFGDRRVGHAAFDVVVDAEIEVGEQAGAAEEDEVVGLGEVFEQQPQAAEVGEVHEVGVVEDGSEALAGVVEGERLFDEFAFAVERRMLEFDAEGVAEDFDGVGISVQCAGDGGDEVLVVGESLEGLFDDGFAGCAAPLGLDTKTGLESGNVLPFNAIGKPKTAHQHRRSGFPLGVTLPSSIRRENANRITAFDLPISPTRPQTPQESDSPKPNASASACTRPPKTDESDDAHPSSPRTPSNTLLPPSASA